jgi:hypothetical protein
MAKLAAGQTKPRVEARTVGLFLSLRDSETRRRGAEIAAGVAHGLGLPGSAARLVSRDDGGSLDRVDDAIGSLSAEGASVIIAGVDADEAARVAQSAERARIPIVLLTPPDGPRGDMTFVVGEDRASIEIALAEALAARGAKPVVALVAHAMKPGGAIDQVQPCADAPDLHLAKGIVVGAAATCSAAASSHAISAGNKAHFGVAFEATFRLGPGSVIATAGLYPVAATSLPESMKRWTDLRGTPPSYFAGLGRDAAVLAYAGVQSLPRVATEDPREVIERRATVAAALAAARADLWTTEAKGFNADRVLPRTVRVIDAP